MVQRLFLFVIKAIEALEQINQTLCYRTWHTMPYVAAHPHPALQKHAHVHTHTHTLILDRCQETKNCFTHLITSILNTKLHIINVPRLDDRYQ